MALASSGAAIGLFMIAPIGFVVVALVRARTDSSAHSEDD
jgi:hypothetical protein